MAGRSSRWHVGQRDTFPVRVATGLMVIVGLVAVAAVWGLWPVDEGVPRSELATAAGTSAPKFVFAVDARVVSDRFEPTADPRNTEGIRLFEAGDFARAAQRFGSAARAMPNTPQFHNNYGWALLYAGQVAGAQRALEAAIRLDSLSAIPHANLAEVLLVQGDTTHGAAAYRRFLELSVDPTQREVAIERLRQIEPSNHRQVSDR
jgi:tetratricopeptide (TPR) repeat protein